MKETESVTVTDHQSCCYLLKGRKWGSPVSAQEQKEGSLLGYVLKGMEETVMGPHPQGPPVTRQISASTPEGTFIACFPASSPHLRATTPLYFRD